MNNTRQNLALKFLSGEGIEIGALHCPLDLPGNAKAIYVDRISKKEAIKQFPELNPSKIVTVDVVTDGFSLAAFQNKAFNFVIANHVLEHSPNPLGVLSNWTRILRNGGTLFISVPIASKCFDRGRKLTKLEHFIEDQKLHKQGNINKLSDKNLEHYIEWVSISEPAILKPSKWRWLLNKYKSKKTCITAAKNLQQSNIEIHFHTFTVKSLKQLLNYLPNIIDRKITIRHIEAVGIEVIALVQVI